ncbi:lipid particle hydrolase [Schizosaccharomyces osmophilus]|uniref:Lipid particle hydrolase n=1 Tax=Schizosaccharomyces osmophilus TaxID=2545709 RepID=A0AAE9W883_9SCHI|nr:lipid particle hydrolase [Schizosaccharomyces osmophilus]WBW71185.1 lipid particle hydrolase [Schizosaccharomyces osmophilus]
MIALLFSLLGIAISLFLVFYVHDAYLAVKYQSFVDQQKEQMRSDSKKRVDPNSLFIATDLSKSVEDNCRLDYEYQVAYYLHTGVDRSSDKNSGRPSKTFVFLHGLGGQMAQFEGLFNFIPKEYSVFSLDYCGCGLSKRAFNSHIGRSPRELTTDGLTNIIEKVIEKHIFPSDSIVLVGHSMGASIATRLAKRLGGKCEALVLLAPKNRFKKGELELIRRIQKIPSPIFSLYRLFDRWKGLNSPSVNRCFSSKATPAQRAKLWIWNRESDTFIWKMMLMGIESVLTPSFVFPSVPTLIITGDEDSISPPSEKELYQDLQNDFSFQVVEAGHCLLVEKPHEIYQKIHSFLRLPN